MPPRNPELPEGTDHIINGAMDTGTGSAAGGSDGGFGDVGGAGGATTGLGGGGTDFGTAGGVGGSGSDLGGGAGGDGGAAIGVTIGGGGSAVATGSFVASGSGDDTGGTAGGGGGGGGAVKQQLRDGVQSLKSQAGERVRNYAVDGKERATDALADFSNVVREAADQIDERLGGDLGQYARRAADAVSDYAEGLRNKEVDDLFDDARGLVRRSPAVAVGVAAAVGFVLVRLVKSGIDGGNGGGGGRNEVEFQPDAQLDISPESGASAAGSGV